MIRQLFWLTLIIICAAVLYGWIDMAEPDAPRSGPNQLVPDYIAYNVTQTSYDTNGQRISKVAASQMLFFNQLEQVQFERPAFTLFDQQTPRWQATSEQGVWFEGHRVILEQNVEVENLHSDELFRKIQSQQLEMALDSQILQTQQPVKILGQGFIIDGKGIRADLVSQKMQLFKHQGTVYQHAKN